MVGPRENDLESAAEDEGKDLEEETGHLDSLRPEVLKRRVRRVVDEGGGGTYEEFTEHCSKAGKAEAEEPEAEGEDREGRVVDERYETKGVVCGFLDGTLLARGVEIDGADILRDLERVSSGGKERGRN